MKNLNSDKLKDTDVQIQSADKSIQMQPVNSQHQNQNNLSRHTTELRILSCVSNVCKYALNVSIDSAHKYDYNFTEQVLTHSSNLVKLCYMLGVYTNSDMRGKIRKEIVNQLRLLCVLVSLAFGVDVFGLGSTSSPKLVFNLHNKTNLYLLNILQAIATFAKAEFYQLHHIFMDSNFLGCC